MNETTPPGTPGADGPRQGPSSQPFGGGFFRWVRGLGLVRGNERWLAGVAGGIAAKANIDPIIVRGIFVVLAVLGGPGVLLYLAAWLILPDFTGKIHLEEVFRGRASATAIILGVLVVVPLIFGILAPWNWNAWGVWGGFGFPAWMTVTVQVLVWIAVLTGIALLVSRLVVNHGRKVRAEQQPFTEPAEPSAKEWGKNFSEQANAWGVTVSEKAAAWGEDVGKQADAWSARYAEHHDAHRLGAAHTLLSIACALLAAGGAAFWAWNAGLSTSYVTTASLIASVVTLAVSLIIAGVRGKHTGWVGFFAFVGAVALIFTSLLPSGSQFQLFGDQTVTPQSSGSVLVAGDASVDLTALDDTDAPTEMTVWQVAGNTRVDLPAEHPVVVKVFVVAGNIVAPTGIGDDRRSTSGPLLARTVNTQPNAANPSTVSIYLVAGNVRVGDLPEPRSTESARYSAEQRSRLEHQAQAELEDKLRELRREVNDLEQELAR